VKIVFKDPDGWAIADSQLKLVVRPSRRDGIGAARGAKKAAKTPAGDKHCSQQKDCGNENRQFGRWPCPPQDIQNIPNGRFA